MSTPTADKHQRIEGVLRRWEKEGKIPLGRPSDQRGLRDFARVIAAEIVAAEDVERALREEIVALRAQLTPGCKLAPPHGVEELATASTHRVADDLLGGGE